MGQTDGIVAIADRAQRPSLAQQRRHQRAISEALVERRALVDQALAQLGHEAATLAEVAGRIIAALRAGRKVLIAGNGGSAAEAQHFAAELLGRFRRERDPYAVLALTADTATLTAVANDYGYQEVFARQVRGLGRRGDLLLAFSTSGESVNLLRAAEDARLGGLTVVAITGAGPNRLAEAADLAICVPVAETAIVQEVHQVITHLLCEVVEAALAQPTGEVVAAPILERPAAWAVEEDR